jgi:outer membrane protein OmpA-like peptidoglycan-associated protein
MLLALIFSGKRISAIYLVLIFPLFFFGCSVAKPLLGNDLPVQVLSDAKTALQQAQKEDAAEYAPLEMERSQESLTQGEKLWSRYERTSGSTGTLRWDDEIRERALYAKLYAQIAQAVGNQKKVEQQVAETEVTQLKYNSLIKQYQAEEAQLNVLIEKHKKLEAERQTAELLAQKASQAKEEAEKYAKMVEVAKQEALKQMELAKAAKEEQEKAAAAAQEEALKAKKMAEIAEQERQEAQRQREEAQRQKELAEADKVTALKDKELAELAKNKAQQEAETARQQLQDMQNKLQLLSSEFAKVKEEKRGLVVTLSDILFDLDQASIKPGSAKNLDYLADILKEYPDRKILVEGHTDSSGSEEHNQSLSEERAFSVMGYLMSHGIDPKQMDAKGYGESKPVASNDTPEGRQQNRRVDIIILNPEKKI